MEQVTKSVFETLNAVNCNDHTEKKGLLTYLSWAWAWAEVKKRYPLAYYTIYEDENGRPYFTDGRTCWVKTGVTIEGLEHIEYLPVMDARNNSIAAERVTSFDMNKAIQRSLTKACARHGLGLYIYAGEDLPEGDAETPAEKPVDKKPAKKAEPVKAPEKPAQTTKISIAENDDNMIERVAKWAAGDTNRVLRARDGYAWEGNALAKFFAVVAQLQEK